MRMLSWTWLALAFALALGCDGSNSSVTGTVGGIGLDAHDALFVTGATGTGTFAVTSLTVDISSYSGACADIAANREIPNSTILDLSVSLQGTSPVGPGTYTVPQPAASHFFQLDSSCGPNTTAATQGNITFDTVTSTQVTGTFSVDFGTGALTGKFDASSCASTLTGIAQCG